MSRTYVEMHPEDAARLNVREGDRVIVATRRGEIELPVWLTGRGRPPRGTLFVPFFDETGLINNITLDAVDPLSKEPDYKKCAAAVRIAANGGGR
jgi:nitrate reductase NapA